MLRVPSSVRLYRRSLGAHVRATLEYHADFWIMVLAGLIGPAVGMAFLGAVFAQVPQLNGWRLAEVVLLYGLVTVTDGLAGILFDGVWQIGQLVNRGGLDYLLVRPYPVVLQVMSAQVGFSGVGGVMIGTAMTGWALTHVDVAWTPLTVLVSVVLFTSALAIRVAITLASNAVSFWAKGPSTLFAVAVHHLGELTRYPVTVYGVALRVLVTAVVPFAFVAFFPARWLLHGDRVGLLGPLVATACLGLALLMFRRGLRRYESAGH